MTYSTFCKGVFMTCSSAPLRHRPRSALRGLSRFPLQGRFHYLFVGPSSPPAPLRTARPVTFPQAAAEHRGGLQRQPLPQRHPRRGRAPDPPRHPPRCAAARALPRPAGAAGGVLCGGGCGHGGGVSRSRGLMTAGCAGCLSRHWVAPIIEPLIAALSD